LERGWGQVGQTEPNKYHLDLFDKRKDLFVMVENLKFFLEIVGETIKTNFTGFLNLFKIS